MAGWYVDARMFTVRLRSKEAERRRIPRMQALPSCFYTIAVIYGLMACAAPPDDADDLLEFMGPNPGTVIVLQSSAESPEVWRRKLRALGPVEAGVLAIEESLATADGSELGRHQYELRLGQQTLLRVSTGAEPHTVLQAPLTVGAPGWDAVGIYSTNGKQPSSTPLLAKCQLVSIAERNLLGRMRRVLTTECVTKLPDGAVVRSFDDIAEGLGLVGSTTSTSGAAGESQGVVRWRLEETSAE